jgi:hypothetical protein
LCQIGDETRLEAVLSCFIMEHFDISGCIVGPGVINGAPGATLWEPERYDRRTGQVASADKFSRACFQPLPSLPARRLCLTNRERKQTSRKAFKHCKQSAFCGNRCMNNDQRCITRRGRNNTIITPVLLIESSRLHFLLENFNDLRGESCRKGSLQRMETFESGGWSGIWRIWRIWRSFRGSFWWTGRAKRGRSEVTRGYRGGFPVSKSPRLSHFNFSSRV